MSAVCFLDFVTLSNDRIHTWKCHGCGAEGFGRGHLFDHIDLLHWDESRRDFLDVGCAQCNPGAKFKTGQALQRHVQNKHSALGRLKAACILL